MLCQRLVDTCREHDHVTIRWNRDGHTRDYVRSYVQGDDEFARSWSVKVELAFPAIEQDFFLVDNHRMIIRRRYDLQACEPEFQIQSRVVVAALRILRSGKRKVGGCQWYYAAISKITLYTNYASCLVSVYPVKSSQRKAVSPVILFPPAISALARHRRDGKVTRLTIYVSLLDRNSFR